MALKVAIQMDPIAGIDVAGDTTFGLALAAQQRGCELYYYQPEELTLMAPDEVCAPLRPLTVRDRLEDFYDLGAAVDRDLRDMDVVLMRQDPPFDMAYITATHFLEKITPECLVVNDPASVRNAPEKLFPTMFDGLQPPTMMTRDRARLTAFRAQYEDIILKPIYGNGGAGVFRVPRGDENFGAMVDMFLADSREPIIAQQYLPDIRQGDKRVILVEGEAVGALNRVPLDGDARSNLHVGGQPVADELSARDLEIAAAIGPALRDAGIVFAGIDVIGGFLTEINVTSPTCIREINDFGGPDIAALVWEAIDARLAQAAAIR
ncbi:MAG: glutathione synthase [Parvibaculales bacterium]